MAKKILITRKIPVQGIKILEAQNYEIKINPDDRNMTPDEIQEHSKDCDALLTMLSDDIDAELISKTTDVKCITNYAVGYNNIDVTAATSAGIIVCNLPGVLARATAELTFALLLAAARKIIPAHKMCSSQSFKGWAPTLLLGAELCNKRLGIIGMGEIGTETARIAHHGFKMQIRYHNRGRVSKTIEDELNAKRLDFEDLIKSSDFICLHTSLNSTSRHMFTINEFRMMKPSALLVNAARGPVVCEEDLVLALQNNIISAAGLDVFEQEPKIHPGLLELENVVMAPHIGSATFETRAKMAEMAANSIVDVLNGKMPSNAVNPEAINQI